MPSTTNVGSFISERVIGLHVMATTEDYGGPRAACLAMMLQRSGATFGGLYPELEHVEALAQSTGGPYATHISFLKAAVSLSGHRAVSIVGRFEDDLQDPRAVYWRTTLMDRANVNAEFRPPVLGDLESLVHDDKNQWAIMLNVPGDVVYPGTSMPVQPCLVVHENAGELTVHNPGSYFHEYDPFQSVNTKEALGLTAVNPLTEVCLLAVSVPLRASRL
jgi:hypothetical protein